VTLLVASALVFAATEVLPGNAATSILGRNATPEARAGLEEQLGLDRSPVSRYVDWLSGAIRLDFGQSLTAGLSAAPGLGEERTSVTSIIATPLVNTGLLILATMLLLIPVSFFVGTASALRQGSRTDTATQVTMLALVSVPEFVVGVLFVILFAFVWPVLPAVSFEVTPTTLVLPVATLVALSVAYTARMIRSGVILVLQEDYVAMARLKGMPEHIVIRRHVLPNAVGPTLQAFVIVVGYLAGGIVVVEYLFAFPGVGQGLVSAIQTRDLPVVQAYVLVLAAMYVVANLIADLLSVTFNPRLRVRT